MPWPHPKTSGILSSNAGEFVNRRLEEYLAKTRTEKAVQSGDPPNQRHMYFLEWPGFNMKTQTFTLLEKTDNLEQIVSAWVAGRSKHPHQTLRRDTCRFEELRESTVALI
jgi:hypothetical protein